MIIAELKNQVVLKQMINPLTYEDRIVDSFYLVALDYALGKKEVTFQIVFTEKKEVPKNPASEAIGEQVKEYQYDIKMTFQQKLNEQEISNWGTDDTYLLELFAQKFNLEIDTFVNK